MAVSYSVCYTEAVQRSKYHHKLIICYRQLSYCFPINFSTYASSKVNISVSNCTVLINVESSFDFGDRTADKSPSFIYVVETSFHNLEFNELGLQVLMPMARIVKGKSGIKLYSDIFFQLQLSIIHSNGRS